MKPKIDFLTIAVTDLKKSVAFYKEGYSANFADPDGHQWEITFMPHNQ